MKKSIFKASFEESLNLEDDELRNLNRDSYESAIRHFENGGPSFKFKLGYFILALFFPIGTCYLAAAGAQIISESNIKVFNVPALTTNLHAMTFCHILFMMWLLLIVIGKRVNQSYLLIYRMQFHVQITSLFWMIVEFNFLFVALFGNFLGLYGLLGLAILLALAGYLMLKSQLRRMCSILYDVGSEVSKSENIVKFFATYGTAIIGLGLVIKMVMQLFTNDISESIKHLGLFITWVVTDITVLAFYTYSLIPHFLPAYYKWKYPEEYREWEAESWVAIFRTAQPHMLCYFHGD